MMAYVLVNVELGSEHETLDELRKIEGVKEAYAVQGIYHIVTKVEAKTVEKLKRTVTGKIRLLDKVRSTLTMIIME